MTRQAGRRDREAPRRVHQALLRGGAGRAHRRAQGAARPRLLRPRGRAERLQPGHRRRAGLPHRQRRRPQRGALRGGVRLLEEEAAAMRPLDVEILFTPTCPHGPDDAPACRRARARRGHRGEGHRDHHRRRSGRRGQGLPGVADHPGRGRRHRADPGRSAGRPRPRLTDLPRPRWIRRRALRRAPARRPAPGGRPQRGPAASLAQRAGRPRGPLRPRAQCAGPLGGRAVRRARRAGRPGAGRRTGS